MKTVCMLLPILILMLLTSCSLDDNSNVVLANNSTENTEISSDIEIQFPMTISNNDLYPVIGEQKYLRLRMVKGKYYENWFPGAYMGTIWEGHFDLELADESGNVVSRTDLDKIYSEPLIFNSSFEIQFDDYNDDGDIDFAIGQYASSNGKEYKLFTLRKDGKIEELTVKGYSSLFISNPTGVYSTKLKKVDNASFKIEYYDNSKGENIEEVFRWDGEAFVKIEN
ncbi:MAG: hypothetical protein GX194_10845 [Clostridium sp.]|nr:hypothetical protein [Clostridium sp.]